MAAPKEMSGLVHMESMEVKEDTKKETCNQMQKELDKLMGSGFGDRLESARRQLPAFQRLFSRFLYDSGAAIKWEKIVQVDDETVKSYADMALPPDHEIKDLLDKLVVVKLNGGLGTSMGCQGPKSVIAVRGDLTFLDLTVQQIQKLNDRYGSTVPLVLMNSFNTDEDTSKIIRKYKGYNVNIFTFNQSCYPRINKESLMPVPKKLDWEADDSSWYPPGHGDFYESFKNSGLLEHFKSQGKEYVFMSNIDNLGATVDLKILNFLLHTERKCNFLMEVTDKTRADVKGGTLCKYDGHLRLLEIAQCPKDHLEDFKSVKKFKIFNTNNLWINIEAMHSVLESDSLDMEVIVNPKTLDNGTNVIQLEQAVGAAIKSFDGAAGVNVPRSRFLPVKKTDDLLLVMSNLYNLVNGTLCMTPLRSFPTTPLIKLGPNHFAKVKEFLKRFASVPRIVELDHLTVSGDVTFGKDVVLKGTVIIIANHGDRIDIPQGAILENKIVSGNLRILDH